MNDFLTLLYIAVPLILALAAFIFSRRRWKSEKDWWMGRIIEGRNLKVRVGWDLCMGPSSCITMAPRVFRLDWSKRKSVFDPAPLEVLDEKGENPESIFLAAQSCPYRAIILEDADTGERLFP